MPTSEDRFCPEPSPLDLEVITDSGELLAAAVPFRRLAAYREAIGIGASQGRDAMAIWQERGGLQLHRRLSQRTPGRAQARSQLIAEARAVIETADSERSKSITAMDPWCAIRTPATTAASAWSSGSGLHPQITFIHTRTPRRP